MMRRAVTLFLCLLLFFSLWPQQSTRASENDRVLILIPGFMGTTLQDLETGAQVWPNPTQAGRLADTTSVGAGELLGWDGASSRMQNLYGDFKSYFESQGYEVIPFEYDWRNDLKESVTSLGSLIEFVQRRYGIRKVDLVAHSTGGLIAKEYILTMSQGTDVDKLITVGTPYLGTPSAYAQLTSGIQKYGVTLDDQIVRHFASVYQMLPTETASALYDRSFFRSVSQDGNETDWTAQQIQEHIESEFEDPYYYVDAKALHDELDDSVGKYVNFFRIIGDSQATPSQLVDEEYRQGSVADRRWMTTDMSGDGFVSVAGAMPGRERTWYVDEQHDSLLKNPQVLQAVQEIVNRNESGVPLRTQYQKSQKMKISLYRTNHAAGTGMQALSNTEFAPSLVLKYPNGSRFVMENGKVTSNPQGLNPVFLGNTLELTVDPGTYQLQVSNEGDTTPIGLLLAKIEQDVNTKRVDYQAISLGDGGQITGELTSDLSGVVGVDADGDGRAEQLVTPVETRPLNGLTEPVYSGDEPPIAPLPDNSDGMDGEYDPGNNGENPEEPGDGGENPGDVGIDLQISGTTGDKDWYLSPVTLNVSVTLPEPPPPAPSDGDAETPPEETPPIEPSIFLSFDGGSEVPYSEGGYTYSEDGRHTVDVIVKDQEGNLLGRASDSFKIDQVDPALQIQVTGRKGENGWWKSDVQASAGATDETSKLMRVDQQVNGGAMTEYAGMVDYTAEGTHSFAIETEDNAGRTASEQRTIKIDKTKPVIADVYLQDEYFWDEEFPIRFTVSDAVSQVQEVQATINGKAVENGKTYRFTEPGWHTYRIAVKDFAGWKTVYEEKFEVYIPVRFTFAPESLQLDHGSGMATAFAELPQPFAPEQIRFSTVQLNGQTAHVQDDQYGYVRNPIADSDDNGISEMMFKYERESLVQVIPPGEHVQTDAGGAPKWTSARLTIFGEWNQYHIKGYDEIRVNNSGYVAPPPDVTAPELTSDPRDGKQDVAVSTAPTLAFSEKVASASGAELTDATATSGLRVTDASGQSVSFTANWKKNSQTVQVNPSREWAGDTTFTFEFAERVAQDAAGNANGLYRFSFTTASNPLVFAPPLPLPVIEVEPDSEEEPAPEETPVEPPFGVPMPEPVYVLGSVSDQTLSAAIRAAQTTGQITLEALEGRLALDLAQLQLVSATGLPLNLKVADVTFTLHADILQTEAVRNGSVSHVALGAEKTPSALEEKLKERAAYLERDQLQGDVRHFTATLHLKNGTETPMTNFNGDLQVGIPLEPDKVEWAEMAILQMGRFNEETNGWELKPGHYDAERGLFLFETDRFSHWALMSKKIKTFTDIADHWAKSVIEGMATNGYVSGMGEGQFAPDKSMTRAEAATLLDRLLAGEGLADSPFADVPKNEWYAGAVGRMYAAGLIAGVDENQFAPYATVTREQLAVMVARALSKKQLGVEGSLDLFADRADVSPWAREAVGLSAQLGIVRGIAQGEQTLFAPQKAATRAEAVTMLKEFLDIRR